MTEIGWTDRWKNHRKGSRGEELMRTFQIVWRYANSIELFREDPFKASRKYAEDMVSNLNLIHGGYRVVWLENLD